MSNPDDPRIQALKDRRSTAELIAAALAGSESEDAAASVSVLQYRGTQEELHAAIALCNDAEPSHRAVGAWILGQMGVTQPAFIDETVAMLIQMLSDKDTAVIAATAIALGHRHDWRAIKPLLALLAHPDSKVRCGVAIGLGCFSHPDVITGLIKLSRDPDTDVRNWATFGLRLRDDVSSTALRKALFDRLKDQDCEIRGEAMIGLACRKDKRATPAIRAELLLGDDLEGDWVFEAAARLGDPSLHADLTAFLQRSPNWCKDNLPHEVFTAALAACLPREMKR